MYVNEMKVLLAGYGTLADNLAAHHSDLAQWHAICRSPKKRNGVTFHYMDLFSPLPQRFEEVDYIIYTTTPTARTPEAYHAAYVTGVKHLLDAIDFAQLKHFFYVSSTSVYGQNGGEQVDEQSETAPSVFSGKAILEGEMLLKTQLPHHSTCIRFGGIYGNQRMRLIRDVQKGVSLCENTLTYTNRIHEQDCVSVLAWLLRHKENGGKLDSTYIATDGTHPSKTEVYQFIAQQLSLQNHVKLEKHCDSPAITGKRCSNQRLLKLGFEFSYPDYRAGYQQMIELYDVTE